MLQKKGALALNYTEGTPRGEEGRFFFCEILGKIR